MAGAVLLNIGGCAGRAGHVVPLVTTMNLLAGVLYICGAYGWYHHRTWARYPVLLALVLLAVAADGLLGHVRHGLPFEQRTVVALVFRIFVTLVFYLVVHLSTQPFNKHWSRS